MYTNTSGCRSDGSGQLSQPPEKNEWRDSNNTHGILEARWPHRTWSMIVYFEFDPLTSAPAYEPKATRGERYPIQCIAEGNKQDVDVQASATECE